MISELTYYSILAINKIPDVFTIFAATNGKPCEGGSFLGLPKWYKYLDSQGNGSDCVPVFAGLTDIWLIVMAVIEILLRVAAIGALIFIVYGGFRYILARGNPDKIDNARNSVQDAVIGLLISVIAIALVNFIGTRFN